MKRTSVFAAALLFAAMAAFATTAFASDARGNFVETPAPPPAPPGQPVPPPTPRDPQDLRAGLCIRPWLGHIVEAYAALPEDKRPRHMLIWARYEADGSIVEVKLEQASGDEALDAAVVSWAQRMRLCPGAGAGEGRLPFEFLNE